MDQTKREILQLFENDIKDASEEYEDHKWLSDAGEVRVVYYGHYPEYSKDFEKIEARLKSFFKFDDD